AEWHDTIVIILIAMFCYQNIERSLIGRPIDLLLFELVLPANITDALGIEGNGLVGLRQAAFGTSFHCFLHSIQAALLSPEPKRPYIEGHDRRLVSPFIRVHLDLIVYPHSVPGPYVWHSSQQSSF